MKISKKSIDSICAVCSDRALGFNYDVLSCGPCKAFFRRNAHHNLVIQFANFLKILHCFFLGEIEMCER
jgi:hypothetical protein